VALITHPYLSKKVKEGVELNLYNPLCPYGMLQSEFNLKSSSIFHDLNVMA
jgi:hypothetical protein